MAEKAGEKRKRSFGTYFAKKPKVEENDDETFDLTDFKKLLLKPYAEQKNTKLVLMIMDIEKLKDMVVPSGPLNFGLYDVNGISVESATFERNNKMRIVSKLNNAEDRQVAIISGWEWYSSTYKTLYQFRNKLRFTNRTEIIIVGIEKLNSAVTLPFKLEHTIERLSTSKSCAVIETCVFMVAKEPIHFYHTYDGFLVSDGKYYGIVALTKDSSGQRLTDFDFEVDRKFKLLNVNAKIMEVENYGLNSNDIAYFMLEGIKSPPVFYVGASTEIVPCDDIEVDFDDRDESDIVYPEKSIDQSIIPLNDYFNSIQIK